jgi:hypothetical protein
MKKYFALNSHASKKHWLIVSVTWDLCPFIPKRNAHQQLLRKVTGTQRISPRGDVAESFRDRKRALVPVWKTASAC